MPGLRALLELPQAWPLSFSTDGSTLLVASDLPGTRQLFLLPARGGELTQLTALPDPVDGQLLPDGRILLAMDMGEVVHVTPHEGEADYGAPAWLPDASGFFAATSESRDTLAVGRYDLAAAVLTRLTQGSGQVDPEKLVEPTLHRVVSFDGELVPVHLPRGHLRVPAGGAGARVRLARPRPRAAGAAVASQSARRFSSSTVATTRVSQSPSRSTSTASCASAASAATSSSTRTRVTRSRSSRTGSTPSYA